MNGMMNAPAPAPTPAAQTSTVAEAPIASSKMKDPVLQKIEEQMELKIPRQLRAQYIAAVHAGLALMFSPQTHAAMTQYLKASPDITANIANGVSALATVIYKKSNRKVSPAAICAASITLALHAADYLEQTSGQRLPPQEVAGLAQAVSRATMAKFGIGQQQIQGAIAAGQAKQPGAQGQQPGA